MHPDSDRCRPAPPWPHLRSCPARRCCRGQLGVPHNLRLAGRHCRAGPALPRPLLLYPLFNVFSASVLDADGERLTLANYAKILGRPLYRAAIANTLAIGVAATRDHHGACRCPSPSPWRALPVPARPRSSPWPPCRWCCPPSSAPMPSILLLGPLGHRHPVAAVVGPGLRLDLRRGRHHPGLHADASIPTCCCRPSPAFKAVDVSMEEAAQGLGSSRAPHVVDGDPAHRAARACWRARCWCSSRRWRISACRFVLAEDMPIFAVEAFKLFIGETAPNPAIGRRAGRAPDRLTTALALLVQRRFLSPAGSPPTRARRHRSCEVGRGPQVAATIHCWAIVIARPGAVLRHRRAVLHGVPRARPAGATSAWRISAACSSARSPAGQHAGVRDPRGRAA